MPATSNSSPQTISRKDWNKASYGTQLTEALQSAFSLDDVANTLREMLNAVVVSKGGNTRPDYRTRERALTLYLNYTIGTPVQRQEQVNYNMDMGDLDEDELIEKLANSPAMLKKVQSMLDAARAKS
jgi:hypothetical protein